MEDKKNGKINEKLVKFFNEQPISKYAIAKKANVSWRTIRNWETGYSTPNLENMEALAEACSVPFETIRKLFK